MSVCFTSVRIALSAMAVVALAACGGGGGGAGSTTPTPPTPPTDAARNLAATTTAQSGLNACAVIQPFYWEVGDKTQRLGSGSVNKAGSATTYTAATQMSIASASKWIYGAYVAQQRGGVLTAQDIQFLNFRSGYTNFGFSGCERTDTVASCAARGSNGLQTPAHVDKFYYNGGHMQVHANLPAPGMSLGALDNAGLATEVRRAAGQRYRAELCAAAAGRWRGDQCQQLRRLLAQVAEQPVATLRPAGQVPGVYQPRHLRRCHQHAYHQRGELALRAGPLGRR